MGELLSTVHKYGDRLDETFKGDEGEVSIGDLSEVELAVAVLT